MAKKILVFSFLIVISLSVFCNEEERTKMRPQDRLILDLFVDLWQDKPENIDTEIYNRGVSITLFYDYPLGYSNFSLAPGVNFTSHNMYSNNWYKYSFSNDKFDFVEIYETLSYEKNRIRVNYIELPFEMRFRSRTDRDNPHSFRFALGAKFGYLVHANTRYIGEYYIDETPENNKHKREVAFKEYNLDNINNRRFSAISRIGYGNVNFIVNYQLGNTFKNNKAEDMHPLSIGISWIIN